MQFIQLCKTLYDMFVEHPHEQRIYHSLATVGTLLLQIGDVGKKFMLKTTDSVVTSSSSVESDLSMELVASALQEAADSGDAKATGAGDVQDASASDVQATSSSDVPLLAGFALKTDTTKEGKSLSRSDVITEIERASADATPVVEVISKGTDLTGQAHTDVNVDVLKEDRSELASDVNKPKTDAIIGGTEVSVAGKTEAEHDVETALKDYVNIEKEQTVETVSTTDDNDSFVHIEESLVDSLAEGANQIGDSRFYVTLTTDGADNWQMPSKRDVSSHIDWDWSITFEQFLASMLTEPALVEYFEAKADLSSYIERFRNRRLLERAVSSDSTVASPTKKL